VSEQNVTPDQNAEPEKKTPPANAGGSGDGGRAPRDPDGYSAAFKAMQADVARLSDEVKARDKRIADLEREHSKAVKERDGYSQQIEQDKLAREKAQRAARVEAKVREQVGPGATELMVKGMLAALHEEGALDRFAPDDKLEETVKVAVEKIKPAIVRPPAQGGGPGGAPLQQKVPTQTDPLASFFGAVRPAKK